MYLRYCWPMFFSSVATAIIVTLSGFLGAVSPVVDTHASACWVEHKSAAEGGDEILSGDISLMPIGSTLIDCEAV
jgi:hypothetical protein